MCVCVEIANPLCCILPLEYNNLEPVGYFDGIENLTACSVSIFTGQNFSDLSVFNNYRDNCTAQTIGNQVIITRIIDLDSANFSWSNTPNNEIALQGFYLYPVPDVRSFFVGWSFSYGGACNRGEDASVFDRNACDYEVDVVKTIPRRRNTYESGGYSWLNDKSDDNFSFRAINYCSQNHSYNDSYWWVINQMSACFRR